MDDVPIDDRLLGAWLDGELAPDERARVQAWLDTHPSDAARVRAWAADAAALRAGLASWAEEEVPPHLQRLVLRRGPLPTWALAASAAGLLLLGGVVGAALGWQQARQRTPALAAGTAAGWVERAAYAHTLYTNEPLHAVEVKAQDEHLARWLTARIARPVKLFNLRDQGFSLVGGRLLPDGPGKSAQLMYEDAAKHRVTVYLRRPEAGTEAAFRYEQHGDLGLFYWVEDGLGYALVGALPRAQLLALAEAIYKQNPATPAAAATQ